MIPRECKRLAEVDFPIAVVSKHSAREKSIRHGHPSTLHLWWARRPLAACRAMLLALLLPDPCDKNCPADFKEKARSLLRQVPGGSAPTTGKCPQGCKPEDFALRQGILRFIGDFANWDLSTNQTYLEVSRGLVKAAHPEETPLVADPFAGGGSIPLEALRLGCDAFASDLNPVACLIEKVMLEDIPRHGPQLAEEIRRVGAEIKAQAEKELFEFYPKDPDGATPIAYLWARTVRCEAPNCGAEIPLARSFWLSKKASRKRVLRYEVKRPKSKPPYVEFDVFEPKKDSDVPPGTVNRAKAKCLCCGTVLAPERVRAQIATQRGGADVVFDTKGNRTGGAQLLAVVLLKLGETGRYYRLPTERDYEAVCKAQARVAKILEQWERTGKQDLCPVPDEPLPPIGTLGFRVQRYGMLQWGDFFTARQKVALVTLAGLARERPGADGGAVRTAMALALGRASDQLSSLVRWLQTIEAIASTFGRPALPMVWDSCEIVPAGNEAANFGAAVEWVAKVIEALPRSSGAQVQLTDAARHPLPDETVDAWFTDPPYYDAVPYSDLSDFFFVWLKRILPGHPLLRDPFDAANPLTPKRREAVQDETRRDNGRPKDRAWFEETMAQAFAEGRRILREDGIGSVVFAHKTTEGWEALLSGMIRGGWTITGSWPIATERAVRPRARESAALATSVHLICRPRTEEKTGDWSEVLRDLPNRVGDWMERLQAEHVRGADLVFACIGPALEIFSRYVRVETADGREVPLAEYLEKVWEVVGRTALEQILGTAEAKVRNGAAGALEEDARLTALFLWTLQSTNGNSASPSRSGSGGEEEMDDEADDGEESTTKSKMGGYSLIYDVVRRLAQPLGIRLDNWEARIIETHKGVVRLLNVAERAPQLVEPGVAHDMVLVDMDRGRHKLRQLDLFDEGQEKSQSANEARRRLEKNTWSQLHLDSITTLDHVHKAMLFQKQGQTTALRELLFYELNYRPEFLRLANSLSALYPRDSEEKRLLDAMLLAVPR